MFDLLPFFIGGLAGSIVLTRICRAIALHFGYLARPKEDRWHKRATPLMGGVAIVVTTLVGALAIGVGPELWKLMVCGGLIAGFGLTDDLLSLKASTKLIAQAVVASLLLFWGFRLEWSPSLVGDTMLTLFWIVGITNAFNLLDNMDGLCSGTMLIAGVFLLVGFGHDPQVGALSRYVAVLLGATAGFLFYNLHPASIFMGDAGSLFLGLNVAALTLMARPETPGRSGLLSIVATPVLLLLIPIFDTALVTTLRLLSGRKPSQGGRDHTSHRLVAIGLSERMAVAVLWILAAAGGSLSVVLQYGDQSWAIIAALILLLAMIIFGVYLARIRVYDEAELAQSRMAVLTPVVANFMYKRRVAEILLDLCLIPIAYYTAYKLRFEGDLLAINYIFFLQSLPVVLASQLLALFVVGAYRGTWRHFGLIDAVIFAKGVVFGTVAAELVILYLYRFESYSRTVFVIYAAILLLLLSVSRGSFRLVGEFVTRRQSSGRRCIIYGTGGARLGTIRDAFGDGDLRILGFVDDVAHDSRIAGYPVLGGYEDLLRRISRAEVDCVVMNTHLVDVDRLQRLEAACQDHDVELLRLDVNLRPISAVS